MAGISVIGSAPRRHLRLRVCCKAKRRSVDRYGHLGANQTHVRLLARGLRVEHRHVGGESRSVAILQYFAGAFSVRDVAPRYLQCLFGRDQCAVCALDFERQRTAKIVGEHPCARELRLRGIDLCLRAESVDQIQTAGVEQCASVAGSRQALGIILIDARYLHGRQIIRAGDADSLLRLLDARAGDFHFGPLRNRARDQSVELTRRRRGAFEFGGSLKWRHPPVFVAERVRETRPCNFELAFRLNSILLEAADENLGSKHVGVDDYSVREQILGLPKMRARGRQRAINHCDSLFGEHGGVVRTDHFKLNALPGLNLLPALGVSGKARGAVSGDQSASGEDRE